MIQHYSSQNKAIEPDVWAAIRSSYNCVLDSA
jgi:hypothetical protein